MSGQFQLFEALPSHIEDALRASIERFGVLVPITVDQNGLVLDGHHRKRIAEELKVPYDRLVRHCADDDERREIAHTLNADRRQLTDEQRRSVAAALFSQGHSERAVAAVVDVSPATAHRLKEELTASGEAVLPDSTVGLDGRKQPSRRPQVIARDDKEQERAQSALSLVPDVNATRTLDVKRLERVAREREADRRRAVYVEPQTVSGSVDIRHGDFREVLANLSAVDAIITDPPYPKAYWEEYSEKNVYEDLGLLAQRILKPNGVLAVMIGTRLEMLDSVDSQIGRYMRRRHRAIYLTPGQRWRDNLERVATGYKPILIYSHPEATDLPWINDDVFTSAGTNEADQRFHHWGQNEEGFAQLVERLTKPGQLVVDPFLGGGTTALVCRDLGRRFIGCDVDAAAVSTSRERVA